MQTFVTDEQVVGNVLGTLFSLPQQGSVNASVILSNDGVNTLNYDFQQSSDGVTWTDMQSIGSSLNNSLAAGQVVQVLVVSAYTQVRCVGNASGGSTLGFSITRYFNRSSGGACPLIAGF